VAQFGSALEWGSRGRGFKSPHSDQLKFKCRAYFNVLLFFVTGMGNSLEAIVLYGLAVVGNHRPKARILSVSAASKNERNGDEGQTGPAYSGGLG
jgi:hypothetical protein